MKRTRPLCFAALGVLAVSGGACGKDRPPEPVSRATATPAPAAPSSAPAVATASAVTSAPASPAVPAAMLDATVVPAVSTMDGDDFPVEGLPAISDDGKLVALADRLEDAGRGHPNLTVSIRRVDDDKAAWSLVVLTADEWDKKGNAGNPEKPALHRAMKDRVDQVNAKLAASTWRPMRLGDARPDAQTACRERLASQRAALLGVEVTLDGTTLRVKGPEKNAPDRDVGGWAAKVKAECAPRNAMKLDRVYTDARRRAVVVRVEYCGDDTCWEPSAAWHVLPLPR